MYVQRSREGGRWLASLFFLSLLYFFIFLAYQLKVSLNFYRFPRPPHTKFTIVIVWDGGNNEVHITPQSMAHNTTRRTPPTTPSHKPHNPQPTCSTCARVFQKVCFFSPDLLFCLADPLRPGDEVMRARKRDGEIEIQNLLSICLFLLLIKRFVLFVCLFVFYFILS